MEDPRTIQPPKDHLDRIHAFARDLAYGVVQNDWHPEFHIVGANDFQEEWTVEGSERYQRLFKAFRDRKWGPSSPHPRASFLVVFGYLERVGTNRYRLTSKAIELLYKPVIPPTIFIAYGRKQSSAFALLLEARLQAQGSSVFVDKIIEGGDEWERKIETTIRTQISHFICLLAPGTLDSPNIRNEINWSYESDTVSLRIPIWHSGFEKPDDETLREYGGRIKEFVDVPNALRVTEESAKAYDGEVSLLLNQLQFS